METILATAFGCKVAIQRGEVEGGNELIAAAARILNVPSTGPANVLLVILHCKCSKQAQQKAHTLSHSLKQ